MNQPAGKRALVVDVADERSIAWGVARALSAAGASLAITYLNAKAEPNVRALADAAPRLLVGPRRREPDALFGRASRRRHAGTPS